jgi:hypothetical protein
MTGIEIRPTKAGDLPALSALYSERFGRALSQQEWAWKYHAVPGESRSWVAVAGDAVLAHAGALATAGRWRAGEGPTWQLTDWLAAQRSPSLRPPLVELGKQLLKDLPRAGDTPFLYGFPSERHFRLGARVFGYLPLDEVATLHGALPQVEPRGEVTIESLDVAPQDSAASWERAHVLGVRRTTDFLNWRYHARPERYYRFYSVVSGEKRGLMVFAFVGRQVQAAEVWLSDFESWREPLLAVAADLRAVGIERWTFWNPRGEQARGDLRGLGLEATEDRVFVGCRGRLGGPDPVAAAAGFEVSMGDYDLV